MSDKPFVELSASALEWGKICDDAAILAWAVLTAAGDTMTVTGFRAVFRDAMGVAIRAREPGVASHAVAAAGVVAARQALAIAEAEVAIKQ